MHVHVSTFEASAALPGLEAAYRRDGVAAALSTLDARIAGRKERWP